MHKDRFLSETSLVCEEILNMKSRNSPKFNCYNLLQQNEINIITVLINRQV